MFYRGYDPAIGRMMQVDPMATDYHTMSPYNYSFNDPVYWNDPSGADPVGEMYEYYRVMELYMSGYASSAQLSVAGEAGGMYGHGGYIWNPWWQSSDGAPITGSWMSLNSWEGRAFFNSRYAQDPRVKIIRPTDVTAWQGGVVLDVNGNVLNWGSGNNIYVDVDGTNLPFHDRLVRNGTMTAEGFSNGLMSVVQGVTSPKFKFDASKLYNGKFSVAILGNDNKTVFSFNGGVYSGVQAGHVLMPDGSHKISYYHINSGPGGLTVDLLRATLGVHEYYGHGILGLDNSSKSHAIIQTLVNEYLSNPNR
jgi:hypothetical protein